MKKINILFILVSMAFAIGVSKGYSCPEGWQELSFDASYTYNYAGGKCQCDFKITYCCG